MKQEGHNEFVIDNYNRWMKEREGIHTMGYGSEESQDRRFSALFNAGDMTDKTILDVGCGHGDFARKARMRGIDYRSYLGVDIVPGMIEIARKNNTFENTEFRNLDILDTEEELSFDYVVMCGPLNLKQADTLETAKEIIAKGFAIARIALAFNMTSAWGDKEYETPHTYYFDPLEIIKFAKTFTRNIIFDHTYLPHDFTIIMRKNMISIKDTTSENSPDSQEKQEDNTSSFS